MNVERMFTLVTLRWCSSVGSEMVHYSFIQPSNDRVLVGRKELTINERLCYEYDKCILIEFCGFMWFHE